MHPGGPLKGDSSERVCPMATAAAFGAAEQRRRGRGFRPASAVGWPSLAAGLVEGSMVLSSHGGAGWRQLGGIEGLVGAIDGEGDSQQLAPEDDDGFGGAASSAQALIQRSSRLAARR